MSRMLTKTLATVLLSSALGLAATPAHAAPDGVPLQPAAPVATDTQTGTDSGSALLYAPLGISGLMICGIWGGSTPDPRPICRFLMSPGSGSSE